MWLPGVHGMVVVAMGGFVGLVDGDKGFSLDLVVN